jgi:hypothetical protein
LGFNEKRGALVFEMIQIRRRKMAKSTGHINGRIRNVLHNQRITVYHIHFHNRRMWTTNGYGKSKGRTTES